MLCQSSHVNHTLPHSSCIDYKASRFMRSIPSLAYLAWVTNIIWLANVIFAIARNNVLAVLLIQSQLSHVIHTLSCSSCMSYEYSMVGQLYLCNY